MISCEPETFEQKVDTSELIELALRGLPSMFDRKTHLFCYRVYRKRSTLVREGISQRYTIMTLLGLHQLSRVGQTLPFNAEDVFSALISSTNWIRNVGDLGLLMWLVASVFPHHIPHLRAILNPNVALKRYPPRFRNTMELAWFLTGCAHLAMVRNSDLPETAGAARTAYQLLVTNQGKSGIFGHQSCSSSLAGLVRGRIGSFADQIYPILAFTHMAKAYGMEEPVTRALACADAICDAQGELGQWWWHYHSKTGKVLSRYPVYSVHQHGMGPMALFALQDVSSRNYKENIYRGLEWIGKTNEIGCDLRDDSAHLVWRCVRPSLSFLAKIEDLTMLSPPRMNQIGQRNLTILCECRPYELGWLLYAFGSRSRRDPKDQ